MAKTAYKILVVGGIKTDLLTIQTALSKQYYLIQPKNLKEASKILSSEKIDLLLITTKAYRELENKLSYYGERINPNFIRILISNPKDAKKLGYLEQTKAVHHIIETPVSGKELSLTLKMAIKTYDILAEKNRLLDKLNHKALSLSIEQKKLSLALEKLKEANLNSIKVLSEAIEAKDPYTRGHCQRVAKLSQAIAVHLGYDDKMLQVLELGAFLHDIGKIGIRGAVLNKDGKLTDAEKSHVKMHAVIGENIVKGVKWCRRFIHIIKHHHEMIDGSGYPDGLKGNRIPLDARILGVADAFDAMTSERPYRNALPLKEALRRLKKGEGMQFDSKLIKIFFDNKIYKKDLSDLRGITFKTTNSSK